MDRRVHVSLGISCRAESDAYWQRSRYSHTKPDAPLQWPQDRTVRLQPNQSSWYWDRTQSQQDWGWEEKESSKDFCSRHDDRPESKGDLEYAESARSHRGSKIETVGDDHRVHQNRTRLKPAEPAVRPMPEGWKVFVHSLRQVQYSHVKTGMICFHISENPEVLNDLVFKGLPAASDRVDRKRKDRGQP